MRVRKDEHSFHKQFCGFFHRNSKGYSFKKPHLAKQWKKVNFGGKKYVSVEKDF